MQRRTRLQVHDGTNDCAGREINNPNGTQTEHKQHTNSNTNNMSFSRNADNKGNRYLSKQYCIMAAEKKAKKGGGGHEENILLACTHPPPPTHSRNPSSHVDPKPNRHVTRQNETKLNALSLKPLQTQTPFAHLRGSEPHGVDVGLAVRPWDFRRQPPELVDRERPDPHGVSVVPAGNLVRRTCHRTTARGIEYFTNSIRLVVSMKLER